MQYSQEHLKTMVYAKFWGQTECIMGNWKIENGIVIQCYLHSCTTRGDVIFLSIPFNPVLQDEGGNYFSILTQLCLKKLCICDRLTMHSLWESIWCRKNSRSCHNVMYNTEIIKILTLRVQIALSLRQDLNIIVSLASIGQPNMILYNPIFVLCMQ